MSNPNPADPRYDPGAQPSPGPGAQPTQTPYSQTPYPGAQEAQNPYSQRPYPGAPYGQAPYQPVPPSGRKYWGFQFLTYIPYVGLIVSTIVLLVMRSGASKSPEPLVRDNARWSANWALSYLLYTVVLFALFMFGFVTAPTTRASASAPAEPQPAASWVVPLLAMIAVGIYWLVTVIVGCVKANQKVHRPTLAIPFFRGQR